MLANELSYPLATIFNISMNTGKFPKLLKISEVIPAYKKSSKMEPSNYRPISLLSNINKIFEKIMFKRLYDFLEKNKCLYDLQFGFRSKHSTSHALITITEQIRNALDKGEQACGIFIDLQKAFDTVNHKILVDKLAHYGVRGVTNNWFTSYLSDRHQYVTIQGFKSNTNRINHGVPQGSVLGPLLFLIYINDLHNAIIYSKVYHFADDTHFLNINPSVKKIQKQMNVDLKLLYKWLLANMISLNCSKTELIIFKPNRSNEKLQYNIKINGHTIPPSNSIKYLGVYLDNKLSGKEHCQVLTRKLNRANGMLSKVRYFVPNTELKSIYHAIFFSHISYNCLAWAQDVDCLHINKIQTLQNKAMRIISFKTSYVSSGPLYIENNIIKFKDLVKLNNCLLVYDFLNNKLPGCFQNFFKKLEEIYDQIETRNSARCFLFVQARNTTKYGTKSIMCKSIEYWNEMSKIFNTDLSKLGRNDLKKRMTNFFMS